MRKARQNLDEINKKSFEIMKNWIGWRNPGGCNRDWYKVLDKLLVILCEWWWKSEEDFCNSWKMVSLWNREICLKYNKKIFQLRIRYDNRWFPLGYDISYSRFRWETMFFPRFSWGIRSFPSFFVCPELIGISPYTVRGISGGKTASMFRIYFPPVPR
jgi:hypothetical protein